MKTIEGMKKVEVEALPTFHWVQDLMYYDGPLICALQTDEGEDWLALWCDCDREEKADRWAYIQVSRDSLRSYLENTIHLADLIRNRDPKTVYLATTYQNSEYLEAEHKWSMLPKEQWTPNEYYMLEEFPECYMPSENCFHEDSDSCDEVDSESNNNDEQN